MCVCISHWLCVHSTVNWSGCSLDWMEKAPGQEVHATSTDGRAHCVAITWYSSLLGMLSEPHPTHTTTHLPGLFKQVSWRWKWLWWCSLSLSLSFLIWPSKIGMGTVGWQGRRGVFFLNALWAAGLICHSLFPLCTFAPSQPCEKHATTQCLARIPSRNFTTVRLSQEITVKPNSASSVCTINAWPCDYNLTADPRVFQHYQKIHKYISRCKKRTCTVLNKNGELQGSEILW